MFGKKAANVEAQKAFEAGSVEMSVEAHEVFTHNGEEPHTKESGQYIKSLIFGGLDGIITTFAVVAGVAGSDLGSEVVLILGFSNLVADGISMGFGDYLSSKAEQEYTMNERRREAWEFENNPELERKEMVEIYEEAGFSHEDAEQAIALLSKNKEWFIDHMLVQELGLMPPDEDDSPATEGLVTFISFLIFGFIPLIAFLIFPNDEQDIAFATACGLTGATLFVLGLVKAKLGGLKPYWKAGFSVLFNGGLAASASYVIALAVSQWATVDCV